MIERNRKLGERFELNGTLHEVVRVEQGTLCRECALYTERCLDIFRNCHKVDGIVVKVDENKN